MQALQQTKALLVRFQCRPPWHSGPVPTVESVRAFGEVVVFGVTKPALEMPKGVKVWYQFDVARGAQIIQSADVLGVRGDASPHTISCPLNANVCSV